MKKIFALPLIAALSIFSSCQKQQTDAERQADVDREVQRRLDAEHQAQEKEQLAQREAELNAREKGLAQNQTENATPPERDKERRSTEAERRTSRTEERQPHASYNTFYTKLEPYGDWIDTSDYGYVFQPRESAGSRNWRPYLNGHWVYSDVGWTWVSEEPFGWATYHYGRWTRLRNVGWIWVPGDEWAPAWVSWRKSNDYVGWAPLPPEAHFDRKAGIRNWADSYYDIGPEQYCFVATNQFGAARAEQTVVPTERNITIVNQTTNVTNITYNNTTVVNQGPNYEELRTRTQQPIQRFKIERQVNVDIALQNPQSIVKGEVIQIPAPMIAKAEAVDRPRAVKRTISETGVDRGWDQIKDQQAVAQAREKIKSEATPPSDAPSKALEKPVRASAENSATTAASATPSASPSPTTESQPQRPTASVAPTASPLSETPQPSASPGLRDDRRIRPLATMPRSTPTFMSPAPSASPSATGEPSATVRPGQKTPSAVILPRVSPSPTISPAPSDQADAERPRVGKLKSQAQKLRAQGKFPMEPSGSVTPSPSSSGSPGTAGAPSASPNGLDPNAIRDRRKLDPSARRPMLRPRDVGRTPIPVQSSSPSPAGSTSPSPAGSTSPAPASPSPTPSATAP
ncbi:MAG: hypothetical protein QOH39_1424 [Verrucomicrobiota bacterium]